MDTCSSAAGVVDFIGSIKNLATSVNDFMHYKISPFAMFFKRGGVFSILLYLLFLTCFSSSNMSIRSNTMVVLRLHQLGMTFVIKVIASWAPAWHRLITAWKPRIFTGRTITDNQHVQFLPELEQSIPRRSIIKFLQLRVSLMMTTKENKFTLVHMHFT